jgi:pyrimidine-nucleoside phosphorylase
VLEVGSCWYGSGPVRAYELIKAKRDGKSLSPQEIEQFISGYAQGTVADYQMAAMCMAVFFRGLSGSELGVWTRAMLQSGEVLDLSDIPGVKVDKHSTGGVGDKVSLCLAPLAAACGVRVPMVAGRGLGHTGGTVDKLESIPGFQVNLSTGEFRKLVREVGACLIGQTDSLAPADKKLYALRDVSGTVECIPLIASSIMSKKLAEGIDALVLDVKVGSGAFMKDISSARTLARTLIDVGNQMGKAVVALLTNMDQPLGRTVGNALEVMEAVEVLQGRGAADLVEVTYALGAEMLLLAGIAANAPDAREKLTATVRSGAALEKLEEIIRRQGGDHAIVRDFTRLPQARERAEVAAPRGGFVSEIDSEAIGVAAALLGAGRERVESKIDPAVGLVLLRKVGDRITAGEPLVDIHYNDERGVEGAQDRILHAYRIGPSPSAPRPLIYERLGANRS